MYVNMRSILNSSLDFTSLLGLYQASHDLSNRYAKSYNSYIQYESKFFQIPPFHVKEVIVYRVLRKDIREEWCSKCELHYSPMLIILWLTKGILPARNCIWIVVLDVQSTIVRLTVV